MLPIDMGGDTWTSEVPLVVEDNVVASECQRQVYTTSVVNGIEYTVVDIIDMGNGESEFVIFKYIVTLA
jgi:hypothetical protein